MSESEEKLEKIAELAGVSPDLINDLGVGNLTEDQIAIIEQIFDLYLTDQESFAEFIANSGLDNIANNLDEDMKKGIENKDDLETLKEKLGDMVKEEDLDLDLDS
ncbi:hypothetical protein MWH28_08030 [Natroniella sulfidigena]|uniref:hypothetical protein n=1 Tax=Natroniella sulfidigena TaxID=723921 RepID=UPI00200A4EB6|nr:hypothetical protein [Natroniella sulfidigena]MCK8817309.1 hypothetical protein [Natroniella sulfidigena]